MGPSLGRKSPTARRPPPPRQEEALRPGVEGTASSLSSRVLALLIFFESRWSAAVGRGNPDAAEHGSNAEREIPPDRLADDDRSEDRGAYRVYRDRVGDPRRGRTLEGEDPK